ncbi:glycosyltransferase family 4 protein [Luteimicrobium sp. NPDC057192]|uniref:glycosyltransferase family 4 protein n=1 Tax=Luteimicrobium sp. NPDC057192 TaxID=3346042 RepID=UPI00362AA77C
MSVVALVASSFLPRVGGVEEHVHRLAPRLQDLGHEVVIWTVDRGDAPVTLPGITVRHLPTPLPAANARSAARFAWEGPRALAAWVRAARADRPDVLHVQCFGPNGTWATAMSRLLGIPLVVGAHGETFMDADRVFETSVVQRRALRYALGHAAAVTACSAYAAEDLARFGQDPAGVDVVLNGVDPDEPAAPEPGWLPARYVLGTGRLVRIKGFDLLLRAFATAGLDDELRLVVAGAGPERDALHALAAELGVADRVVLPGSLPRDQVVTVMRRAEALVVPSRVEAFGIVVLEGLRAGVPVVATARGGVVEIVTDGVDALVVDPEDQRALAVALRRAVVDPALRERLATAGPRTAALFTWERVARLDDAVYRRLPARRRR